MKMDNWIDRTEEYIIIPYYGNKRPLSLEGDNQLWYSDRGDKNNNINEASCHNLPVLGKNKRFPV